MSRDRLVLVGEAPLDRLNGADLRLWHLCGEGDATVVARRGKSLDFHREPLVEPLPWRELRILGEHGTGTDALALARTTGARYVVIDGSASRPQDVENWLRLLRGRCLLHFSDSMSLHFRRLGRSLPWVQPVRKAKAYGKAVRIARRERAFARSADTIVVSAAADRTPFLGGRARVHAIGNGTSWTRLPVLYTARDGARVLAFHGNMEWEPNIAAAEWIATAVLPRIRATRPDTELRLAGGPATARLAALARLPGVRTYGHVADLRGFLAEADLYVMPMTLGSGFKNKLAEAMAAGLPVVTNALGAEALDDDGRACVRIDEGPGALAAVIAAFLGDRNRRQAMSDRGRAYALRHLCWETAAAEFRRCLVPFAEAGTRP